MANVEDGYTARYTERRGGKRYPVEFVVRMFLGSYPGLRMSRADYAGSALLDLGAGDGRNLPLLHDLGFRTSAVEITEEICIQLRALSDELGLGTDVRKGSNAAIPFDSGVFDYVVSSHALYYVQPGQHFGRTVSEVARVMRPGGVLVASLPKKYDRYILRDAIPAGDNHLVVTRDPLGIRNGMVFRVFETEQEIRETFAPAFHDLQIGWIENDFFGIEERLWIVKMIRA